MRLVVAALLLACATASNAQSINTNYLPGTDFSGYHSYRWVTVDGSKQVDQILDQQIRAAVDKQLAAKGLTKKDADPADMYVAYQVAMDQEKELNAWGAPGWRFNGMASVSTSTVDIGTLAVDFYDPGKKEMIWRGTATESVGKSTSPEKKQEHLDKAMAKLLKKFPPQAK